MREQNSAEKKNIGEHEEKSASLTVKNISGLIQLFLWAGRI